MKLIVLTFFIFIGAISVNCFAQEPDSIASIDAYISAVEQKISEVKSDPEKHKQALEDGWYYQMQLNIKAAKRKRRMLLGESEPKQAVTPNTEENRQLPKNTNY